MCKTFACKLQNIQRERSSNTRNPPSVFWTPKSFVGQSLDAPPRNPERSHIDHEYWLKAAQKQEIQNDTITSWESLETFCNKFRGTSYKQ